MNKTDVAKLIDGEYKKGPQELVSRLEELKRKICALYGNDNSAAVEMIFSECADSYRIIAKESHLWMKTRKDERLYGLSIGLTLIAVSGILIRGGNEIGIPLYGIAISATAIGIAAHCDLRGRSRFFAILAFFPLLLLLIFALRDERKSPMRVSD